MTQGSAVRHVSVVRHVTDCAMRPGAEELQREITLIELVLALTFLLKVYMNMFAKFDELPTMTLRY